LPTCCDNLEQLLSTDAFGDVGGAVGCCVADSAGPNAATNHRHHNDDQNDENDRHDHDDLDHDHADHPAGQRGRDI